MSAKQQDQRGRRPGQSAAKAAAAADTKGAVPAKSAELAKGAASLSGTIGEHKELVEAITNFANTNKVVGMRSLTEEFMSVVEKCKTLNDVFTASVKFRIFNTENTLMFVWLLASVPDAMAKIGKILPAAVSAFDASHALEEMKKSFDESYENEIVEHFLEETESDGDDE